MSITHLDPVHPVHTPDRFGEDSPIRKVTRQIAFEQAWDGDRAAKVAELFDNMSETWTADHDLVDRYLPLQDALDRGEVGSGRIVELGSGTGLGTRMLNAHFGGGVTAMDLSLGMLRNAPADWGSRTQADSSMLPLPHAAADVLVLVNMFLFPAEVDRVLSPGGALVWVNTMGAQTPIHLPPEDVVSALPGDWTGVASHAGFGIWAVVSRA